MYALNNYYCTISEIVFLFVFHFLQMVDCVSFPAIDYAYACYVCVTKKVPTKDFVTTAIINK